ncbi:MAG: DNA adenine methylase [Ignavibacteriales bacterium]|nr:DNA adenine methylase [Ignavibacteriales bacterium]
MNKLFAYPGGKWTIRHLVVSAFPEHTTYVDVFGGSAAILLSKERSKGEVFNDKNEMLVNFFRVVKHRPAELSERAKNWIHSRTLWNEFRFAEKLPADEVERAIMFWARLQDSFGARGMNFGMCKEGIHSVTSSRKFLDQVSERLSGVHVECSSFEACIKNYDSPETLFYLDPPYPNTAGGSSNYNQLSTEEWEQFRSILGNIKAKFLLSCNDDPFVLKLFKGFNIKRIKVRVTLAKNNNLKPRNEILVSNYALPRVQRHAPVYDADRPAIKEHRNSKATKRRKELAR